MLTPASCCKFQYAAGGICITLRVRASLRSLSPGQLLAQDSCADSSRRMLNLQPLLTLLLHICLSVRRSELNCQGSFIPHSADHFPMYKQLLHVASTDCHS